MFKRRFLKMILFLTLLVMILHFCSTYKYQTYSKSRILIYILQV